MRLPVLWLLAAVSTAPLQCTKKYDPSTAREETAGDGLWDLAEDFKAKGNTEAQASTLRFLVARYPSSRRAPAARDELARLGKTSP